ncbi:unnamed protein product [Ceutorhynchus assimilis]|uniref:Uncharacterized protein n=1 Tax=Ceutorhynchus assimilis TaxID=467358 RepID=A0A9N9MFV6_9CUCU|nr:unnamed protein product [Ceutorhynchus assimilis]
MGSSSSQTRKFTVENDEVPASVIKVSENVANRLRTSCTHMDEISGTDSEYWHNRTKHMEESHREINVVIDREFNKALNEVKSSRTAGDSRMKEVPCLDYERAVLDCYRMHNEEPMCCARIVQAFQECVDFKRVCLLNANKTESE